jgi:hypothetical protein
VIISFTLALLAAMGIAFAMQNKLPDALDELPVIGRLLACAFCSAFHAGWMAYLLVIPGWSLPEGTAFAFASAFVYWMLPVPQEAP